MKLAGAELAPVCVIMNQPVGEGVRGQRRGVLVDVGLCRRVAGFTACGTERVGRLNVEGDLDVICKARDRSSVEPVSCSAVLVSSIVEELYFCLLYTSDAADE